MILTTDAEIRAAVERGKRLPRSVEAIAATYLGDSDRIAVSFDNGFEVRFPRLTLEDLEGASAEQLSDIEILAGRLLVWNRIVDDTNPDEVAALYIPDLIEQFGLAEHLMAKRGRLGGSKTSPAKTAAVRANGKKGGRPKKRVAV